MLKQNSHDALNARTVQCKQRSVSTLATAHHHKDQPCMAVYLHCLLSLQLGLQTSMGLKLPLGKLSDVRLPRQPLPPVAYMPPMSDVHVWRAVGRGTPTAWCRRP